MMIFSQKITKNVKMCVFLQFSLFRAVSYIFSLDFPYIWRQTTHHPAFKSLSNSSELEKKLSNIRAKRVYNSETYIHFSKKEPQNQKVHFHYFGRFCDIPTTFPAASSCVQITIKLFPDRKIRNIEVCSLKTVRTIKLAIFDVWDWLVVFSSLSRGFAIFSNLIWFF